MFKVTFANVLYFEVAIRTEASRAYSHCRSLALICTEGFKERYIVTHLRLQSVFIRYLLDLAEI